MPVEIQIRPKIHHRFTGGGLQYGAAAFFLLLTACSGSSGIPTDESDPEVIHQESLLLDSPESLHFHSAEPPPPSPPPPETPPQFPEAVQLFEATPQPQDQPVPGYLVPIEVPDFSTWLTRITDNDVYELPNGQAVHLYSKHQAWNADETLIDVANRIVDAQTYEIISPIPLSTARNWSNIFPHLLIGIGFNKESRTMNRLATYDTETRQLSVLTVFSEYRDCTMGEQEGNVSSDDRYVVLSCIENSSDRMTLISYDLYLRSIIGTRAAEENYNWASVSPSGRWILVENNRFPDTNPSLLRYDLNFGGETYLGRPAHGDFGVDDKGEEAYVMIAGERFYYFRLSDGREVEIPLDFRNYPVGYGHLSCRNTQRPGWCYFSSKDTGRVGAINVSADAQLIEPWGYHHSTSSSYHASPRLTVNRQGTQLLFASDWYGFGQINAFVLDSSRP